MGPEPVPALDVIPSANPERAKGTIATPLLRIGGSQMRCLQRVWGPNCCHSLLGLKLQGLVLLGCVDEATQTSLRNLTNSTT